MKNDLAPTWKNPTTTAFIAYANKNGGQDAVVAEDRSLTYIQLNQKAHKLAYRLHHQRDETNEPVIVLLDNDIDRFIALLGIQIAGMVYLPLDSSNPGARLTLRLQDTALESLVVNSRTTTLAHHLGGAVQSLIDLDEIESEILPAEITQPFDPHALAWIIFTSGSTGQPKGVMQTYQNCNIYTRQAIDALHMKPNQRAAIASPLTSSAGVVTSLAVLSTGGTVYFVEPGKSSARVILESMADNHITILLIAPTLFRRMVANPEAKVKLQSLRSLRLTGEAVTKGDFDLFNKYCHPECILSVGYGTTETAGICQSFFKHPASVDGEQVSVGTPHQNFEINVIDKNNQPVAINHPGVIVVKSKYISPGYWKKPHQTRLVFSETPEGHRVYRTGDLGIMRQDGSLEYLGRKDTQIKILGQRVEISEIEAALRSIPFIKEAAIHGNKSTKGEWRLEAFTVIDRESGCGPKEIREALADKLPAFMLPHIVTVLDNLPLTRTGKIDRVVLAQLTRDHGEQPQPAIAPLGDTEKLLTEMWIDVLGNDRVGRNSDFLALGGDSLSAGRIINDIYQEFQVEISLRDIMTLATIAELADLIEKKRGGNK